MVLNKTTVYCNRCQTFCEKQRAQLNETVYYCQNCLNLGGLDSTESLVHYPEPNHFAAVTECLTWKGKLTSLQQRCADQIVINFKQGHDVLLWAVTGAGKTEISFSGIAWALSQG